MDISKSLSLIISVIAISIAFNASSASADDLSFDNFNQFDTGETKAPLKNKNRSSGLPGVGYNSYGRNNTSGVCLQRLDIGGLISGRPKSDNYCDTPQTNAPKTVIKGGPFTNWTD